MSRAGAWVLGTWMVLGGVWPLYEWCDLRTAGVNVLLGYTLVVICALGERYPHAGDAVRRFFNIPPRRL